MALADLNVRLGLITKDFERSLKKTDRQLRQFQRNIGDIGSGLTNSLTVPLVGFGAAALSSFAKFEQGAKALAAVTKDAKSVEQQLKELQEVAKLPGLGFQEAVQGSARLQAVGLSADAAAQTLEAFGNAVARSGGGRVELEGALVALTQIASKGKISAEEINQLNERIFEIRPALEAAFGTADSEELQKLGISSEEFIAKVTQELGKLEKVQGGLANSFENLGDSVRTNLARAGAIINETFDFSGLIDNFDKALTRVVDTFDALDPATQKTVVRVAAFAASIGPVLLGISKLIALRRGLISALLTANSAFKSLAAGAISAGNNIKTLNFKAFLTPQLIALTAAIGAAALVWKEFNRRVQLATASQKAVKDVTLQAQQALAQEEVKVAGLIDVLKDETATRDEKETALRKLQDAQPGYFDSLDVEKSKIEDITAAYENFRTSILLQAQAQAAVNKLTEIASQRIEKLQEQEDLRASLAEQVGSKTSAALSVVTGSAAQTAGQLNRIGQEIESLDKTQETLISLLKDTEDGLNAMGGSAERNAGKTVEGFDRIDANAKKIPETIAKVNAELAALTQKSFAFGVDTDSEKLEALGAGVDKLFSLGASADSAVIQGFVDQIDTIRGGVEGLNKVASESSFGSVASEETEKFRRSVEALGPTLDNTLERGNNFVSMWEIEVERLRSITQSFNDGVTGALNAGLVSLSVGFGEAIGKIAAGAGSLKGVFSGILDTLVGVIKQVGKIAIETGVALLAIKTALKSLNPVVAILAGTALIALASAVQSKLKNTAPGLAEGGIVPPGFPNDTFPARLSSNEAVIPLDRLPGLLKNEQQVFIPSVRLQGEDLVIAFNRAQNRVSRFA